MRRRKQAVQRIWVVGAMAMALGIAQTGSTMAQGSDFGNSRRNAIVFNDHKLSTAADVGLAFKGRADEGHAQQKEFSGIKISCSQKNETTDTLKKFTDWLKAAGLSNILNNFRQPVRAGKVRCIDIMKSMAGAA